MGASDRGVAPPGHAFAAPSLVRLPFKMKAAAAICRADSALLSIGLLVPHQLQIVQERRTNPSFYRDPLPPFTPVSVVTRGAAKEHLVALD